MTGKSSKEIEVKLAYKVRSDVVEKLKKNGFRLTKKKEIRDLYFTIGGLSLAEANSFYRIREVAGEFVEFTLKDSFQNKKGVRTKRELNVSINDSKVMMTILSTLNCKLVRENASKREYWEDSNVVTELIDYYKPLKLNYIEIEGRNKEAIEKAVTMLGNEVKVVGDEIFAEFDKFIHQGLQEPD